MLCCHETTVSKHKKTKTSEGQVAAVDALQPCGTVPLEDLFEDDMQVYSFWDDVHDGWLNTDRVTEARNVELDMFGCIITEFTFEVNSSSAHSTLEQLAVVDRHEQGR